MVHDADLEDGKFQTTDCIGIDRVLKGWGKSGLTDEELCSATVSASTRCINNFKNKKMSEVKFSA